MPTCCLGHWAFATLHDRRGVELRHPDTYARVYYGWDREEHLWDRAEFDQYGQEMAAAELYSLTELFNALYQDETEGFQAIVDGEAVVL